MFSCFLGALLFALPSIRLVCIFPVCSNLFAVVWQKRLARLFLQTLQGS